MTTPKRPSWLDSPLLPKITRYASRAHVWIYRRTRGRIGGQWRIGDAFGTPMPTLLLEHRGRKSGKTFATPLLYVTDGPNIIVVASAAGAPGNPQWYYNLLAHPDTYIEIGGVRRAVGAVEADPQERARLWPRLVAAYADFDSYQSWTDREIPVLILEQR
ncbi:nitroreductase family deazaflavin-dependent oxidoreductase [Nocardia sp. NPDC023852]|uniref:nitroreductase family deazaflavin-dependent oxidoreductase n=1 Tax=Nocardia sp. NPDC023852 TaxID=3154697 RepID=UPI003409E0F4